MSALSHGSAFGLRFQLRKAPPITMIICRETKNIPRITIMPLGLPGGEATHRSTRVAWSLPAGSLCAVESPHHHHPPGALCSRRTPGTLCDPACHVSSSPSRRPPEETATQTPGSLLVLPLAFPPLQSLWRLCGPLKGRCAPNLVYRMIDPSESWKPQTEMTVQNKTKLGSL